MRNIYNQLIAFNCLLAALICSFVAHEARGESGNMTRNAVYNDFGIAENISGLHTIAEFDEENANKHNVIDKSRELTCNSSIDQLVIHNLTSNTNTALINGGSYALSTLPSNWNIQAMVSGSNIGSVKFTFSGSYTGSNIENAFPYRSPGDNVGLNLGLGTYSLNVKIYLSGNAGGGVCDQETITFTITGPQCNLSVDAGPDQNFCFPSQMTLNSVVAGGASCQVSGTSDCNHSIIANGGYIHDLATAGVCGDDLGAKLFTLGNQGTAYIILDLGTVVPSGTEICARLKLEHCQGTSSSNSDAKIEVSLSSGSGFSNLISSLTFSQTNFQEFCYTLTSPARFIKISDNGKCAFRVDYVKYTTQDTSNGALSYEWSGPGIVSGGNQASVIINQGGTYTITVTDCAGCVDSDTVVISGDSSPPVFNDQQAAYTLNCGQNIPLIQPTATDNSSSVSYSYLDTHTCTQPNAYCSCTHVRVWTATDLCSNTATFTQSFTYSDIIPPVLNGVPSNTSVECIAIPAVATVTATDNCDQQVQVSYNQTSTQGCPYIITRTWTAVDDCGNSVSASQTINVNDTQAPVLHGLPELSSVSVSCYNDVPAVPTSVTVTDNCGSLQVHFEQHQSQEGSSCNNVITRVWSAVDACGNPVSFTQTITVNDTIDPVFTYVPQVVANCSELIDFGTPTAQDNCGGNVQISYVDMPNTPAGNEGDCGQFTTYSKGGWGAPSQSTSGSYRDAHFAGCFPNGLTIGCGNASYTFTSATAIKNFLPAGGYPSVLSSGTFLTNPTGIGNNLAAQLLAATLNIGFDACDPNFGQAAGNLGNLVFASGTFAGLSASTVIQIANDVFGGCSNAYTVSELSAALEGINLSFHEGNTSSGVLICQNENENNQCSYTATRVWTATDACGNSTSVEQHVTVSDAIAPVATFVPASVEIECGNEIPNLQAQFTDNCDLELTILQASSIIDLECGYGIHRSWKAIDDCGNETTVSQNITVIDTTEPVLHGVPFDINAECGSVPEPAVVTATDNCDSDVVVEYTQTGDIDGCNALLVRTWTATDACGNTVSASQTISVGDTTDPVLHGVPSNVQAECGGIPEPAVVTATDNCDENVVVEYSQSESGEGCNAVLVRTWTATDACGNTVSTSQTISVGDSTDPELHGVPSDVELSCSEALPVVADVTATDNCDEDVNVSYSVSDEATSCGYIQTRTWTATDDCGNSSSATQFITVTDDEAPVVSNQPENIVVECGEEIPAYIPVWTDNCDTELELSAISGIAIEGCNQLISASWTAVDNCGNSTTVSRLVTIVDTTNPVATFVPADVTYECDEDVVYQEPVFTDNCDQELTVTPASSTTGDDCLQIIHRSWTAVDDCGNEITVVQNITIEDTTAPYVVDGGEGTSIECGSEGQIPGITIADNCDPNPSFTYTDGNYGETGCANSFDRTYLLVDACGNESTFVQHISVGDDTPPVIYGVGESLTVQCIDEVPAISNEVWAEDNCDDNVELLTFGTETGDLIAECVASTAFGPGADWALWFPELFSGGLSSSANFNFDSNGGSFDQFADGTAHLYGTVVNSVNPNEQFVLNIWFENGADWITWSGLGRGYKDDLNCATPGQLYQNWTYYEMVNNLSVAVGTGDLAGVVLQLQHMPSNYYFGFQVGQGANNKNCNYGASGWFTYTGFSDCEPISGHGDVNADLACEPVFENECGNTEFTYTYQAIDDAGNITIITQVITVEDTTAPEFTNCPSELWVSCTSEVPAVPSPTAVDNCGGDVTIVYLGETIEGNVPCDYLITRSWYAEDLCGNRSYCVSKIHVHDETAPVFTYVPADITVECSDEVPFVWATATDNCSEATVTYSDSFQQDECYGYIVRTFTAIDACGNTSQATHTISIIDSTAPVFAPFEINAHIECEQVDNLGILVQATDNCSEVEITYTDVHNSGGCLGVIMRTYIATDACGNTATALQYISIQDTHAPVIEAPEDFTAQCSDDLSIPQINIYDNCGSDVTVNSWSEIVSGDACTYILIWHWTATDYCENVAEDSTVITVVDTTNPWFGDLPQDMTVSCSDIPVAVVLPLAYDNCDQNVNVESSDNIVPGDCPQTYTIERVLRASDDCGNYVLAIQYIHVVDELAPVIEGQSEVTVECNDALPYLAPIATDNCGNVTLTYSDSDATSESPCQSVIVRTWTAIDQCGNSSTFEQYFTIVDSTAPVFDAYVVEINRPCDDFNGIYVTATDNCNEFTITSSDEYVSGGCAGRLIRTYVATDICGNVDSVQQIITLIDLVAPVADFVQANFTAECGEEFTVDAAIFSDNCDTDLVITSGQNEVAEGCTRVITYSWTAVDHCGNTTTVSTVVTVVDTTNPWFGDLPQDLTVSCTDVPVAVVLPAVYDNCDENVNVESSDNIVPGDCPQTYTIERVFRASDDCGNYVLAIQYIHVVDEIAPVIEGQSEVTVECNDALPYLAPNATDNCGNVTLTYADSDATSESPCQSVIVRTWTAIDQCGNSSSFNQFFTIVDTTAPVFDAYVVEINRPCDDFNGIYVTASDNCNEFTITSSDEHVSGGCAGRLIRTYYATDICGNVDSVQQIITLIDLVAPVANFVQASFTAECGEEFTVDAAIFSDNCDTDLVITSGQNEVAEGCTSVITYTWTAVDHCGNTTTVSTVVTVVDTTNPWFGELPSDITISCSDELAEVVLPSAYDNCDESVNVESSDNIVPGNCPQTYTIERIFRASDDCGNYVLAIQFIHVVDEIAPVIEGQGEVTVECNDELPYLAPNATDNCGNVTLSFSDSEATYESPCQGLIVRTWTAIDECGNSSTFNQYITIVDTTAPVFNAYNYEINLSCDNYEGIYVTATDNCNEITITSSDENVSGGCAGRLIRTYVATDICGNVATAQQIITLTDATAPVVANQPEDLIIECGEEIPSYEPVWSDNCDAELELSAISSVSVNGCNEIISVSWTATDHCGNTTTVSRTVTIVDTTAPEFTYVPASYTGECSQEIELAGAIASDNCDENVTVGVSVEENGNDCGYTLVRTFIATDDCGNTAIATQTIDVVDTTAPEFTYIPAGGLVSCTQYNGNDEATAADLCSSATVTHDDQTGEIPSVELCGYRITRTWTAVDACGNVATAVTIYDIYDNVGPVFDQTVSNVTVQCVSEVPAYAELTATDACSNAIVERTVSVLQSDECGNQLIQVSYVATDACGNESNVSYSITVNDQTAPVLSSLPENLVLDCTDEIPSAAEMTAIDNCGGEVEVMFEEHLYGSNTPAEGSISDCQLRTPLRPAGNPCGYPYDWAMAMFGMPNAHKYYTVSSGQLIQYPNGTIHVIATMNNAANPANGFYVDVQFNNGMDWASWSTQNFITGFKADCGGIGANHTQWMYYLLNNNNSTLQGFGAYQGSSFTLSHAPSNKYFGFQLGDGANNYNGANDGFGGWFSYSGIFVVNGQHVGAFTSGAGDFAFELDCCPDYTIARCWTAVDCSGNVTQHCQTISFGSENNTPLVPVTPTSGPIGKINATISVYPNPVVEQATFLVKATENGRLTVNLLDLTGAKVAVIMNTRVEAGQEYKINFDAGNLAAGVYMYQMFNGSESVTGSIIVSK